MLCAMKYLPAPLILGALALAMHAQTPAAKPDGDPFVKNAGDAASAANPEATWMQCVVTIEAYALDKEEAAALFESERGSAARYRRVLELAKAGKARLEILEGLTTKSGQRAVVESIDEVRYATEFAAPATAKGMATPTAWETRNVGDTFELEPVIGPDGRTCDVNLVPQRVRLAEFRDMPEIAGGVASSQPIFNAQKITTSTRVSQGEPQYLGTMTPPTLQGIANSGAPSETWLAFLHVNVQGPPPGKAKARAKAPVKPEGEAPAALVELQYSCYSLDRAAAREILVASASMNAPWEKVKALLAEKKARLEHVSAIKTNAGQRAVTEEIQEVRYTTEYAPEHHAASTETTQRTVTNQIGDKKAGTKPDSTSSSTENVTTTRTDASSEVVPGHASAFEARNTGVTVEVEPVVSPDGATVDLNQVIQSVKFAGNLKTTGIATRYPAQPLFQTSKVTTSLSLPLDLPVLVSTLNPPGADGVNDRTDTGRTFLLFVRATLGEP